MKLLYALGLLTLITGCCCNKTFDVQLMDINDYDPEDLVKTIPAPKYADHLVACRPNPVEKDKVNSVLKAALDSKKDIVLYFHGGLSSQKYMNTDLGPGLMESIFGHKQISQKVHPIFMNYDAGPEQHFQEFYDKVTKTLKNHAYEAIEKRIKEKLGYEEKAGFVGTDTTALRVSAAYAIESFKNDNQKLLTKSKGIDKKFLEDNHKYYIGLLEAKDLPSEFKQTNKSLVSELDDLASNLLKLDQLHNDKSNLMKIDALKGNRTALGIIRILARFALDTDHGFLATIQEEVLDAIKVSNVGALHWNMVKRHAKQCFAEGSNGRAIVDDLIKNKVKINTISHSAGSLPTAELINYISKNKPDFKLSNVVMLVPALNHKIFEEYVVNNKEGNGKHKAFDNLYAYSLSEEFEKKDKVFRSWLYSSSLLYAVSSLGEEEITLDQMLLINQHLRSNRKPYNYSLYLDLACEEPEETWKYLNVNAGNLIYYPLNTANRPDPDVAATHEYTKYPWESWDLANDYVEKITGLKLNGNVYKKVSIKGVESQLK